MARATALCLAALAAAAALHSPARASLPVPYAVVGCIVNGAFQSRGLADRRLSHSALKALEGRTIRVEGLLSPGDRFAASAVFVVDAQCRVELHRRYFLCDPCMTLPGMAHKMLPKQSGAAVALPRAAIGEFDNLGRGRQ